MWMRSEALVACGLALWAGSSHAGTRVQGVPADEVGVITLERGGFGSRERYRLTLRA